jgi:crotonobetainyl-CoA:carnitine CoA-transferase CaiB-like acyl-CoA transferase
MLRISGYGQTGPYRDLPGFGAIGEAMGGLRHLTGEPGRVPVRCGISIGDTLAALHGTIGVLTALYHRQGQRRPGPGDRRGACTEAVFNVMESLVPGIQRLRRRARAGRIGAAGHRAVQRLPLRRRRRPDRRATATASSSD